MVEIHVFGALWEHVEPRLELDLGCDVTVADLIARLGINLSEVGIVTVDRRQSSLDEPVPASCRVCIFPLMSGG
jgi:molybdopterin converting factor small subunit